MPKKIASFTIDEMRAYKLKYYNENKDKVQKERIITGIQNGKRMPSQKTLEKYNILVNEEGKIIIPPKQPKYEFTASTDPKPNVINIVRQTLKPVENYNYSNTALTGRELTNYIVTVLQVAPANPNKGTKPLSKTEFNAYKKLPYVLFEMRGLPYDEEKDLTPWLCNAETLIQSVNDNKNWAAPGTKAKFVGRVLRLSREFPPLGNRMSQNVKATLDNQWREWNGLATVSQRAKTANKVYFSYDTIRKAVFTKYKKVSYENLLLSLYNEVIARDNFGMYMAYTNAEMKLPERNYMLLDTDRKEATIYMNEFKTDGSLGQQIFKLSKGLYDLIVEVHAKEKKTPKKLFPGQALKLGGWMGKFLSKIPAFKDEGIDIVYMRHSVISSKLMALKDSADYTNGVVSLARIAMHSAAIQTAYVSRLKDIKEKEIYDLTVIEDRNVKVERALENTYNTRSKAQK